MRAANDSFRCRGLEAPRSHPVLRPRGQGAGPLSVRRPERPDLKSGRAFGLQCDAKLTPFLLPPCGPLPLRHYRDGEATKQTEGLPPILDSQGPPRFISLSPLPDNRAEGPSARRCARIRGALAWWVLYSSVSREQHQVTSGTSLSDKKVAVYTLSEAIPLQRPPPAGKRGSIFS